MLSDKPGGTSVARPGLAMTPLQTLCASSTVLAVVFVSQRGWAEEEQPQEEAPQVWIDEEQEATEATYPPTESTDASPADADEVIVDTPASSATTPAAVQTTQTTVTYLPDRPERKRAKKAAADSSRFRGGVGAIFGGARYEDDDSFHFMSGVEARFGGQLDDTFGLYFAPSILVAEAVRLATGVALDVTVADVFSLGAGLEGLASSNPETGTWTPGTSIAARSGFHIGKKEPGRRRVFSLETVAKVDLLFDDRKGLIVGAALGYDAM